MPKESHEERYNKELRRYLDYQKTKFEKPKPKKTNRDWIDILFFIIVGTWVGFIWYLVITII